MTITRQQANSTLRVDVVGAQIEDLAGASWSGRVQYPNQSALDMELGLNWMRFNVFESLSRLKSLGSPLADLHGFVLLQIFVPLGSGTDLTNQPIAAASTNVQNKVFSEVHMGPVSIDTVGETASKGRRFYQTNMRLPFRYEYLPA